MVEQGRSDKTGPRVVFYTTAWIIAGELGLSSPSTRLTDLMNNWGDDFFPLDGTRLFDIRDGSPALAPDTSPLLVHRDEILLVHEAATGDTGAGAPRAAEMKVQKRPTLVRGYAGPLRIEGTLYLPQYSKMSAWLNIEKAAFVPLTAVSIFLPGPAHRNAIQVPFALVRRVSLVIGAMGETTPGPAQG